MIPILYDPNEKDFRTNGIGPLRDILTASVQQELNGLYELAITYPLTGAHAAEITDRCIIAAKPDPTTNPQPFRIYRIVPASAGTISVYARHLSYDLSGIIAGPVSANSAAEAMVNIKAAATTDCPFNFCTDKSTAARLSCPTPRSLWRTLGGSAGSLLDVYRGEYEFDGYNVRLLNHRGTDRGVEIRYGKNLRTLEMDRSCAEVYTGVYPYWCRDDDGEVTLVQLPETILPTDGTYDFSRIYDLDLSQKWQTAPTDDQLRAEAKAWMKANHIGEPVVSWKIEFTQLEQTEEYKGRALLERVLLGDTVHTIFPVMGVNVAARAVRADFDPVGERYNSVTLGRVRQNLADTIISQGKDIADKPSRNEVSAISQAIGKAIIGANGGSVRMLDRDGDGMPDELYIADNPDPAKAVKVWRWNYEGWAGSDIGYNGPFKMAATFENGLESWMVRAAQLIAGTIQSADGETFFLDLDNGILKMKSQDLMQESIASISVNQNGINQTVESIQKQAKESADSLGSQITEISSRVDQSMTADQVNIQIEKTLSSGVSKVNTSTGFTFDDHGLNISQSGNSTESAYTANGMSIKDSGKQMLTADRHGVEARNLHATTYLVIGNNSRIEDIGNRSGIFFIG